MSAAVLDSPEQLGLEGLPPAPAIAPPGIAVRGQLERHAEVRTSTDGRVHLVVQVLQPKDALPFVAIWHADSPDQASDLRLRGPHMHRGAAVVIVGAGLVLGCCDNGNDALLFQRCESVLVPGVAAFTHRTNQTE
jgi:hypothetical protein